MTPWTKDVARRVDIPTRGAIVVTLTREGITFRVPRRRHTVLIPYGVAMTRAEILSANVNLAGLPERKRKRRAASLLRGR